ncbi:6-carboxytetrahydropterin synthase [Streptosporangium subroseum]|uniref:6-pyruvoyl trahydropterin synthase family protein n=1 Tax=Streptosporangium subroseum TaxID=106412 RepID=UPI003427F55F
MPTTIEIGGHAPFGFSAAHTGLHDGQFEPLHGHSFTVTLRLHGRGLDAAGMLVDFHLVKKALAEIIAPLRRRTLMPAQPPGGTCTVEDGQVVITCGGKCYSLPEQDVALLPVPNTTTEALAAYLLEQLLPHLHGEPALRRVELVLAEAPDTCATVVADLPPEAGQ